MKKLFGLACALLLATTLACGYAARHYYHKNKNRFQVKLSFNEPLFQEKLAKEPPTWMKAQIASDLQAYESKKISKESLDQFFSGKRARDLRLIRFSIQNRHLRFSLTENNLDFRPFRHILAVLKKINDLVALPDIDFILSLEDGFAGETGIPLFVYAKAKEASSLVLMPDFKALTGYPTLRREIEESSQKHPWETKVAKAFWRGSTTGGWLTALNWRQIPRVKLAFLSQACPALLDARLTGVVQCDLDIPPLIRSQGLLGPMVSQADHLRYKYLVDVDGNSCSFERYFWALLSNSVVLKQMTPNIQWYYGALNPYEHFIPVKEDLSDLFDQIQWAKTHDKEAQQIAARATAFIRNELTPEDTLVYMTHLLREYAKRQIQLY